MKKTYVVDRIVHLGTLKRTLNPGVLITYVEDKGETYLELHGDKITDLHDFKICVKANFFRELQANEKADSIKEKVPKAKDKKIAEEKMKVVKSDEDQMRKTIDISATKNTLNDEARKKKADSDKLKVIRERSTTQVRGMDVIKEDSSVKPVATGINYDTDNDIANAINGVTVKVAKIGAKSSSKPVVVAKSTDSQKNRVVEMDSDGDMARVINGNDSKIVAKVTGDRTVKKLVSIKGNKSQEAEAKAKARKAQSLANQAKIKKELEANGRS